MKPKLLSGTTWHRRRGAIENAFRYRVDFVLLDAEAKADGPALFSRNRTNLMALHDKDHGGPGDSSRGAKWMRKVLAEEGATEADAWRILLLAQPRIMGTRFTPVSFWFAIDAWDDIRAVVAEVNNTYGDRHSYFCANEGFEPIAPTDVLTASKVFHVSPFQPIEGRYNFSFRLSDAAVSVRINYENDTGGLQTGVSGDLNPLTSRAIIGVLSRRPLGSLRVLALIHWQALKLWRRGAEFRSRPMPPASDVSR